MPIMMSFFVEKSKSFLVFCLLSQAQVLVATTVIENGIDMPNVNTILVFSADRFGMSTLYQLRGRVGRSTRQAYAYFLTKNNTLTTEAENRLTYVKVLLTYLHAVALLTLNHQNERYHSV